MPRLGGARGLLDELRRTAQAVAVRIAVGVAVLGGRLGGHGRARGVRAAAAPSWPAGRRRNCSTWPKRKSPPGATSRPSGCSPPSSCRHRATPTSSCCWPTSICASAPRQQARVYLGQALAAAGTAGLAPAQRRAAEALQAFLGDPEAGPSRLAVLGRLSTGLRYRSNANGRHQQRQGVDRRPGRGPARRRRRGGFRLVHDRLRGATGPAGAGPGVRRPRLPAGAQAVRADGERHPGPARRSRPGDRRSHAPPAPRSRCAPTRRSAPPWCRTRWGC